MKGNIWWHIKVVFGLGIVLIGLLQLWGCAASEDAAKNVMGLVTTSAEDDWKDEQYACLATVAVQEGFELMQLDVLRTQSAQIEAIRALIVYGVDVIVFCPIVQAGWDIVLLEAQSAGIPVIAYVNNVVTTQDVDISFVGFSYMEGARQAALTLYAEREDVVGELYGTLNAWSARQISSGFRAGLSQFHTTTKYSLSGDYLRSRGYEIMEAFVQEMPDIGLVVCQNDAMALGAIDCLRESDIVAGRDIRLCVFGGGQEVMNHLGQGAINMVIYCDNQALAQRIAKMATTLIANPRHTQEEIIRAELMTAQPEMLGGTTCEIKQNAFGIS